MVLSNASNACEKYQRNARKYVCRMLRCINSMDYSLNYRVWVLCIYNTIESTLYIRGILYGIASNKIYV